MKIHCPAGRSAALLVILLALLYLAACSPAAAPTSAPASQTKSTYPAAPQATAPEAAEPTRTSAAAAAHPTEPKSAEATPTIPPEATSLPQTPTSGPARTAVPEPTTQPLIEGRLVELEWPERLRIGDSDVIRLSLVPTQEGYVAKAEFPDHTLQTREVPIPRPDGYELYAIARLDGVGFDIAPTGDQERFVPAREEIAWRWSLAARKPGQQRLSVQLRLRWMPADGVAGPVRESQAYARGLDVQVSSFFGMSSSQAASTGFAGLLLGCGFLLAAVVWRGGRAAPAAKSAQIGLQVSTPNPLLKIEAPHAITLQDEEDKLLRALFHKYDRLVIENEFLSGYSGARTFLVQPIRPDGCADALAIVKLGPRPSIEQEYANYENFVKDRLPPMTARIQQAPVALADAARVRVQSSAPTTSKPAVPPRGAVQYTFIAEPGKPPVSLRNALLEHPDPAYLMRLFDTFGPNWWMQRRAYTFHLEQEYDELLPPHYVLEPAPGQSARVTVSQSDDPAGLALRVGEVVQMQRFERVELRADGKTYSLVGMAQVGRPSLRIRWQADTPPRERVTARVVASRADLLRGWTRGFDRFGLPDPLDCLPAVLKETVMGTRSVIHGDLNLENVLVGPGSLVWLIDFAQTREGHPLYDFAHLESELIAHVLAVKSGSAEAYLKLWQSGSGLDGDPLVNALHGIAARCLFDSARPREYHLALFMACLGALKYPNLSPLAKNCLYLTAAELSQNALC